ANYQPASVPAHRVRGTGGEYAIGWRCACPNGGCETAERQILLIGVYGRLCRIQLYGHAVPNTPKTMRAAASNVSELLQVFSEAVLLVELRDGVPQFVANPACAALVGVDLTGTRMGGDDGLEQAMCRVDGTPMGTSENPLHRAFCNGEY